jgi:hypothetical protein
MPTCTSSRLTRLCLVKGVVLLGDLVEFARRQPTVQEIVLSDPVILQHGQGDRQLLVTPAPLHMTREHLLPSEEMKGRK